MTTKTSINFPRVLLGGILAGLIFFVVAGIVNGGILKNDFEGWMQRTSGVIHPLPQSDSLLLWALMCFLQGVVGVWIYAGIRPRFGAGHKTALIAALVLWIASKLSVSIDFITLGIFPYRILTGQLVGSFVSTFLGIFVGAWFYKEDSHAGHTS
ncbi:hypothetical protein EHO60_13125 [Leptospira fletcheri]|uniref:DUF1761 domain-containing protein n=1 Tax=Leptospira fletcheri TaxID=2484981 RepID=A0A4R9GC43_9LEPT|nr:hypothetical protein [Leptospira fletcheri]TGK08965.1 hypothetical protein EHO60_13125 [Leptospira fletcheri]